MTAPPLPTQDTADTRLGRAIAPLERAHPGKSAVVALARGMDAFAARAELADAAERSLDIQTYIWETDISGGLMFDALRRAAARGVRVRLLLDDNNTAGMDEVLAELVSHRNLEVRLFNPFRMRRWRGLGYLTDFSRLNRRMHNKTFTADDQVTIIGGRNIGDEYLGVDEEVQFIDLDVMAVGAVVHEVTRDFERYWSCRVSSPAETVLGTGGRKRVAPKRRAQGPRREKTEYMDALAARPFVDDLLEQRLPLDWVNVRMVSDDPKKIEGRARKTQFLWSKLSALMSQPKQQLDLVSAYFVPGRNGVAQFAEMARRGVAVTILTNSLAATDVAAVHAGYAKRRRPLLEAGVRLLELKRTDNTTRPRNRGRGGSSDSSLHAKAFAIDGSVAFVGSFNFDPRSVRLNTEIAFIIESPALAAQVAAAVGGELTRRSYEVKLAPDGSLRWVEREGQQEVVHDREPGAGLWRRLVVSALSVLPIEWLL